MELLRTVAQLDIELSLVAPRRRGCFEKQRSRVQHPLLWDLKLSADFGQRTPRVDACGFIGDEHNRIAPREQMLEGCDPVSEPVV